jgi:hypothetical protein
MLDERQRSRMKVVAKCTDSPGNTVNWSAGYGVGTTAITLSRRAEASASRKLGFEGCRGVSQSTHL